MKLNWSKYIKYIEKNVNNIIPKNSGVYKLSAEQNDGSVKVRYVGQAKNLLERSLQHLSESEENDALKESISKYIYWISFAEVNKKEDRDAVEKALYNHYKPKFNDPDCIPDVEPADINFN